MSPILLCLLVFVAAYLVNMTYITVFYHRGFAHGALVMRPWLRRFVAATGGWVTGIDPKAWVCMHRRHHLYSDTERDPHSPVHAGVFGLFIAQLHSYQRTLASLILERREYTEVVADLEFGVGALNAKKLWWLPYAAHIALGLGLGLGTHWMVGLAYFVGLMSHPIEGWLVNSLGHAMGYRNFETPDNSRNNWIVALLVMGEGLQNNHHQHPGAVNFAMRWFEPDLGYGVCQLLRLFGLVSYPARSMPVSESRAA